MRDIPDPVMSENPVSVEVRRNGEPAVASRIPCDVRGRTFVAAQVTEVVPLPSVCSTAAGLPQRTSLLPGRRLPLV